jgi:hypothetical protein
MAPAVLIELDPRAGWRAGQRVFQVARVSGRASRRRRTYRHAPRPKACPDGSHKPSRNPRTGRTSRSRQAQRQRELRAVDGIVSIDEVLQLGRHVAQPQIAALAQLGRDID